ncbi:MAG: hypothetical protein M3O87_02525, partial [Candidatus Dormibacteraeota bacterium]|nr:hypothetical protein [Candidatus Dormibacteraeota bacterium]
LECHRDQVGDVLLVVDDEDARFFRHYLCHEPKNDLGFCEFAGKLLTAALGMARWGEWPGG